MFSKILEETELKPFRCIKLLTSDILQASDID